MPYLNISKTTAMKAIKNQFGFTFLEGLVTVMFLVLVAGAGWYVWDTKNKSNEVVADANKKAISAKPEAKKKLPDGFKKTTIDKLGLSFAYPKDWGELAEQNISEPAIYAAGFSGTTATPGLLDDEGPEIMLFANNGKQDLSSGGRGGALWDAVGFTEAGGKYLARSIYVMDGKTEERGFELEDFNVVQSVNTKTVTHSYDYFDIPVYEVLINLKGDYYGATIVAQGRGEGTVSNLKELAATVEIK